ncbi:hypothetical protein L1D15_14000 [Vibrio sp. Isolate25]|uniref:hypothetical protein n=1 Tax=Vibrio sp. Isolate25 TaxID=2908535 RepID=UPI001EFCD53A|nr:hypothetical protein [Vibrio sp. Isolate25]MCG9597831.1 hypothetical protein [Vibrio sp. Isolate25]
MVKINREYQRRVLLSLFLVLFSANTHAKEIGLHASQVYLIESYQNSLENITDFSKEIDIKEKLTLNSNNVPFLKKVGAIEIDVTYLEDYRNLFVSYGKTDSDGELVRFQSFSGKLVTLQSYLSEVSKHFNGIVWLDLKYSTTYDLSNVCNIVKSKENDFREIYVETQSTFHSTILRLLGCDSIYWISNKDIGTRPFSLDIIGLFSNFNVSGSFTNYNIIKDNYSDANIFLWTNGIKKFDSIQFPSAELVLYDLHLINN